jgi:hypothetical protein
VFGQSETNELLLAFCVVFAAREAKFLDTSLICFSATLSGCGEFCDE